MLVQLELYYCISVVGIYSFEMNKPKIFNKSLVAQRRIEPSTTDPSEMTLLNKID